MFTIKRIFSGITKETVLETLQGVQDYLRTELCRDEMFIIVDWPVNFRGVTIMATDFKAPGECCASFAQRLEGMA